MLVYISVLFHYWSYIAVFFCGVISLMLRFLQKWSRCYQIIKTWWRALVGNRHFIQYLCKKNNYSTWWNAKFHWQNGRSFHEQLTCLMADCLFWTTSCCFISGHVGLLCFSLGFSDLSVIGSITVLQYCNSPDFKSQAPPGKLCCHLGWFIETSNRINERLGKGRKYLYPRLM